MASVLGGHHFMKTCFWCQFQFPKICSFWCFFM